MKYEKLFEKGKIGRLELRNRVVMTAMGVMLGDWNGCATPEYARFYEERAKAAAGSSSPSSPPWTPTAATATASSSASMTPGR